MARQAATRLTLGMVQGTLYLIVVYHLQGWVPQAMRNLTKPADSFISCLSLDFAAQDCKFASVDDILTERHPSDHNESGGPIILLTNHILSTSNSNGRMSTSSSANSIGSGQFWDRIIKSMSA